LAAALNKPTVAIYGPTDTKLVGISGKFVEHICVQQDVLEIKDDKSPQTIKTSCMQHLLLKHVIIICVNWV